MSVDVSVLQPIYRDLYDLLGETELLKVFEYYRGAQVTFPVHLYQRTLVSQAIAQREMLASDCQALARHYGYSERWIRNQVRKENRPQ
ncbi:hypothetical protein [Lactiplantibacillus plantarum]|uniref:hypothetical protein n=1 Tax=Lactiplantibacillus plantarum TaxID=1590 RepID=UPI0022404320|nr:hypothetical protein [Lactiplantibacillus plantarum]MCG0660560.1 hypothetical protein [Lactiplantibacillus plantarum]